MFWPNPLFMAFRLIQYPAPPCKGRITVTKEDLACLDSGEFLNDVIIDFYLKSVSRPTPIHLLVVFGVKYSSFDAEKVSMAEPGCSSCQSPVGGFEHIPNPLLLFRYLLLEGVGGAVAERSHIFSSFFYKQLSRRRAAGESDVASVPYDHAECSYQGLKAKRCPQFPFSYWNIQPFCRCFLILLISWKTCPLIPPLVCFIFSAIATRGTRGSRRGRAMLTFSPKTSCLCLSIKSKEMCLVPQTHTHTESHRFVGGLEVSRCPDWSESCHRNVQKPFFTTFLKVVSTLLEVEVSARSRQSRNKNSPPWSR